MATTVACNQKQAHDRIRNRQAFGIRNPVSPTGFSFQGGYGLSRDYVVKSYGVVIGRLDSLTGEWELNDRKYSVTTSRHQSILRGAL